MGKDIQNDRQVVNEEKPEAVRLVTIRSVALFCTAVVTAAILAVCVLGSVAIYQAHGDKTTSRECLQCETPETDNKMMDTDMEKEMMKRMEDGHMIMERFSYDYESNILLIEVPGNYSGNYAATVALDYQRSVIYANIHDENMCIALAWSEGLATAAKEFMTAEQDEGEIIDVVSSDIKNRYLVIAGEIPTGYFKESTDMTVSALCAGKQTYWLQDQSVTGRRRRWSFSISISFLGFSLSFSYDSQ